jgi:hypothetical protein
MGSHLAVRILQSLRFVTRSRIQISSQHATIGPTKYVHFLVLEDLMLCNNTTLASHPSIVSATAGVEVL